MLVCPDYEGFGITAKNDHPYICHDINAKQLPTETDKLSK